MAAKTPDPIVGSVYGRLTVTSEPFRQGHNLIVPTLCRCGIAHNVMKSNLVSGKSKSCGCLNSEVLAVRSRKYPEGSRSTYLVWFAMLNRCTRKTNPHYINYGGRGIKVCDRWKVFMHFLEDMGNAPKGMTLERRKNDEGYSKDNCEWVPCAVNQLNKRTYRRVEYQGTSYTVLKLSRMTQIPWRVLYERVFDEGWTVEKAINHREET